MELRRQEAVRALELPGIGGFADPKKGRGVPREGTRLSPDLPFLLGREPEGVAEASGTFDLGYAGPCFGLRWEQEEHRKGRGFPGAHVSPGPCEYGGIGKTGSGPGGSQEIRKLRLGDEATPGLRKKRSMLVSPPAPHSALGEEARGKVDDSGTLVDIGIFRPRKEPFEPYAPAAILEGLVDQESYQEAKGDPRHSRRNSEGSADDAAPGSHEALWFTSRAR